MAPRHPIIVTRCSTGEFDSKGSIVVAQVAHLPVFAGGSRHRLCSIRDFLLQGSFGPRVLIGDRGIATPSHAFIMSATSGAASTSVSKCWSADPARCSTAKALISMRVVCM